MKLKYLILAFASVAFFSCDDTLDLIGSSIQPDSDLITLSTDTFSIKSATVIVDSIYAKTDIGLLGNFQDDTYGSLKCDYYGQLYCPEGFYFHKELLNNKLDSATVLLSYTSYVGDSLAPMQASVYKITDTNFFNSGAPLYSNSNAPAASKLQLLAKKGFTAYDMSLSDSLRSVYGSTKYLEIKLPQSLTTEFYNKVINDRATFANNESFQKYFPGLYITTTYGTGAIIKAESTQLRFYFKYTAHTEDTDGNDSVYTANGARSMAITKEVYQSNRYENNKEDLQTLIADQSASYIKTPAGVFTQLTIPIGKMAKSLKESGQRLNGVTLEIGSMRVKKLNTVLQPPTYLLMVKKEQMDSLFSGKIEFDSEKHLYATYSSSDLSYTFSNLRTAYTETIYALENQMITAEAAGNKTLLAELENKTQDVLLVPFTTKSTNSSTSAITAITHYFEPSAVKLYTKDLKMSIIHSK